LGEALLSATKVAKLGRSIAARARPRASSVAPVAGLAASNSAVAADRSAPVVFARFPVLPPAAALVEIAVLFCLIIGLGWLTGQDISDMRPHPFWVPVLLLSLQYGTVSGLLAAGIATLFTAFGQLPEQTVGETYFVYFLRIWIEPILWLASAVLLGQFRMRQIADKMELVRQVEELGAQRTSLAGYASQLRQRCEGLERRLAGRQEPDALVMLQSIARARQLGAPGMSAAFAGVMQAVLPGAQASLFVLDQDWLRQALTVPATGSAGAGAAMAANGLDSQQALLFKGRARRC
jgi:hypothetical protein